MNRPNTYSERYYQYQYATEGEEAKMRAPSASQRLARYTAAPVVQNLTYPPPPTSGMNVAAQEFNPYSSMFSNISNPVQSPKVETKTNSELTVGTSYSMYVSYVEDGPYLFALQLKADVEDTLPRLSALLSMSVPKPCVSALLPGSSVMARFSGDNKMRRAIVKDVSPDVCTIYYADYGNTDSVPSKEIYELPASASSAYPMALKFSLANVKNTKYSKAVKDAFKQYVEGKLVRITVTAPEASSVIYFCDMFLDGSDIKSILDSFGTPLDYVGHPVVRDDCDVTVSFNDGPSQFFIQYSKDMEAISAIQNEMNRYCPSQPRLKSLSSIHIGDPVAALYEDNEWYRAMVVGFHDSSITVLYVDFGNRWQLTPDMLCSIKRELVTKWKTQAVECCLEGFETATPDLSVTQSFISLTQGLNFTMKVKRLLSGTRLEVDLILDGVSFAQKMKMLVASNEMDNLTVTCDNKGRNVSSEPVPIQVERVKYSNDHDDRHEEDYSNQNWKSEDRRGRWGSNAQNDSFKPHDNRYKRPQENTESDKTWGDSSSRPPRKYNNDQGDFRKKTNDGGSYNKGSYERKPGRTSFLKGEGGNTGDDSWNNDSGTVGSGGGGWRNRGGDNDRPFRDKKDNSSWKDKDEWKPRDDWKNKPREERSGGDGFRNRDYDSSRPSGGGFKGNRDRDYESNRRDKQPFEERRGKYSAGNDRSGGGSYNSKPYQKADHDSNQYQTSSLVVPCEESDSWDDPVPASTHVPDPSASAISNTPSVSSYNCLSIETGSEFKAHLSHLDTPNHFYLQLFGSEETLDEIRAAIDADTSIPSRLLSSNLLTIGTPLISIFSEDNQFYRSVIKQLQHDYVVVRFVDYGNTSIVPHNEAYSVPIELGGREMQAICCNLIDIKPATNDSWDPDVSYSSYFEADYLNVKVLGVKRVDGEEVFSVSIGKPDGQSISQELLDMKLALPAVMPFSAETDVDEVLQEGWIDRVSLLRDQYLHVTLLKMLPTKQAVVRLKDVNLVLLADSMADDLREGIDLIMWIMTVEDNRVSVRFFSLDGIGLDGGEPICPIIPLPIVRSIDSFTVVHVEGTTLYVQKVSDSEKIDKILSELFDKYSERPAESIEWEEGMVCCALSSDGNWYRAKIVTPPTETALITYLDYGNQEEVPLSSLKSLDLDHYFPQLALPILLPCNWTQPCPPIAEYTLGNVYKAHIYRSKPGQWVMNLSESQGVLLIKRFINQGLAIDRKVNPFDEVNTVIGSKLLRGMTASVIVSHFDSPSSFWVHLQEHLLAVDTLQANLQEVVGSLEEVAMSNTVFATQYSEDNVWYRAVEVEPGSSFARFIDYGNTDTIMVKKILPEELLKPLSGYAVPMSLCVRPAGDDWSAEAVNLFDEFIDVPTPQKKLYADIISVDYKIVVDLRVDKKSLSKLLIDGGHGVWDDMSPQPVKEFLMSTQENFPPNTTSESASTTPSDLPMTQDAPKVSTTARVFISAAISENDFYIQDESKLELINLVTDSLASLEDVPLAENIKVGDIVAAFFNDDEYWYRARVLSIDPLKAFFIDYGNISNVDQVKTLPENLITIPPLATHCSLGLEQLTEASFAKFQEIYFEGTVVFNLEVVSDGEPELVKLFTVQGDDVKTLILQAIESVEPQPESLEVSETPEVLKKATEDPTFSSEVLKSSSSDQLVGEIITSEEVNNEVEETTVINEPSSIKNPLKNGVKVVVSHCNSLDDFYVQEAVNIEPLNCLTESMMNTMSTWPIPLSPKVGDTVAVLSPDYFWYRAKVVAVDPELTAFNIDTGAICKPKDIRMISDEMTKPLPFATHVSFETDSANSEWYEKFTELINSENNIFTLTVVREGSPPVIKLENSSGEDLLTLCMTEKPTKNGIEPFKSSEACPSECRVEEHGDTREPDPHYENGNVINLVEEKTTTDLNPSGTIEVLIPFSLGPIEFYTQKLCDREALEQMSAELNKSETEVINSVSPSDLVLVLSPDDNKWYRGSVLTVINEKTTVKLVDYGKCLTVTHYRKIPSPHDKLKWFASKCCLSLPEIYDTWTSESFLKFSELTASHEEVFCLQVLEEGSPTVVELWKDGSALTPKLLGFCYPCDPRPNPPILDLSNDKCTYFSKGEPLACYVVNIRDLTEFYVQLDQDSSKIADIFEKVENEVATYESLELSSLKVGDVVIAKGSDESTWYRSKVSTVGSFVEVQLIDFGNTSVINEARKMPESLLSIPPLAYQCSLLTSHKFPHWGDLALDYFKEVSGGGVTSMLLIPYFTGHINIVDFSLKDSMLSNLLMKLNDDKSEVEGNRTVISFCLGPTDFCIQEEKSRELLALVASCLEGASTLTPKTDFEVGELIAACVPETGSWYRVKVSKTTPSLVGQLIDYGNSSELSEGRALPESIVSIPPLSKPCKLALPPNVTTWSEEAVEKFLEFIDLCNNSQFVVTVLDESDVSTVNLRYGPLDISKELFYLMRDHRDTTYKPLQCVNSLSANVEVGLPNAMFDKECDKAELLAESKYDQKILPGALSGDGPL